MASEQTDRMTPVRKVKWLAALIAIVLTASLWGCAGKQETTAPEASSEEGGLYYTDEILYESGFGITDKEADGATAQKSLSLEEYLEDTDEKWFLTGKKKYTVQAMMVSGEISFHNDYEVADYTVTNDGETVVLKGTMDEMWSSPLSKVIKTYTKPDGSELSAADFTDKDVYIDIVAIPASDTNFAMHVPNEVSVTVETTGGDVLHTNLPNAPHGEGDYLVCRAGTDGEPDLSNVWIVNGAFFADRYETVNMPTDNGKEGDAG